MTPFHHDWWHGCLAQVAGRKRYRLVHPFEAHLLQRDWEPGARFDLIDPPIHPEESPELHRLESLMEGIVEPGEILYIPPYWFHEIATRDDGAISIPLRYDTAELPDIPLFQLSQDSELRSITNHDVRDVSEVVEQLRANRRRFLERERQFVESICKARDLDASPGEILDAIEEATRPRSSPPTAPTPIAER